jgi:hypothetical protein
MLALARAVRPVPTALLGALAGALVAALPLLVLARLLHQHTNHRPLGAATFAVLALLLVAFFSLAGWRALVAWPGQSSRRLLILGGFTLVLSGLAALAASHAPWRASVTDGVVLITLCVAASVLRLSDDWSRRLSRLAAPSWLVLALVGGILSQATIGSVVGEAAPVLSPLNGW